jgi:hypothetical protein
MQRVKRKGGRGESPVPDLRVENIEELCREVKKVKPPVCYWGRNTVKMLP